jgi:3-oxoacyl-[acyl-carrier protein] reductase
VAATDPIPLARELAGRAALVTGSAANIGRAIALALADAGADVLVHARTSKEAAMETVALVRAKGVRAELHLADIADPVAAKGLVEAAAGRFGRLDVLVNNASMRQQTPLAKIAPQEWRAVFGASVDGPFFLAQAAAPHLAASGQGAIVNLGGVAAHAGVAGRVHAATAKAAVIGLTKSLAHELAPARITVNCVVPGLIDTVRGASAGGAAGVPKLPPNLAGRNGEPNEIAAMVRFLAGPAARYTTGQTIHVNGGMYLP